MDSAHELAIAQAVAAVEASAEAAAEAPASAAPAAPAAAAYSNEGDASSTEADAVAAALDAYRASASAAPFTTAAAAFTAAAAAAGVSLGIAANGRGMGAKTTSAPKRKRLLRLEGGDLAVIPTNIYKQAGGLKLDITLGGFRIDGEKCTLKNRAYNFGVLPGFTRENLLALRYGYMHTRTRRLRSCGGYLYSGGENKTPPSPPVCWLEHNGLCVQGGG